jgi:hypothetical protein
LFLMGGFREFTGAIVPEAAPQGKCDKRRVSFKIAGPRATKRRGPGPASITSCERRWFS